MPVSRLIFTLLLIPALASLGNAIRAQCGNIDFIPGETQVCAPKSIKFFGQNIPAGSTVTWNYGAGETPGKDTGQYIFTAGGNYTITMKVTLSDGVTVCTVSKPNLVSVYASPQPSFTVSNTVLCNGFDTVVITDNSNGGTSRRWVVEGVPLADTSKQIIHPFTSTGFKEILLELYSANCPVVYHRVDSAVRIYTSLDFDFEADTTGGCVPANIRYTPVNISPGHTVGQYSWNFAGGSPSTSFVEQPVIFYSTAGIYNTSLTITNTDGCSHQVMKNDYITLGDSTSFSVIPSKTSGCRGEEFILNISNPTLPGNFTWDLGNATVNAGSTPHSQRVVFADTGYNTFKVTREHNGCITQKNYNQLVLISPPLANFIILNPVECDSSARVFVFNRAKLAPGYSHTYLWKFYAPNGTLESTSTDSIPVFYTSQHGNYTLEQVVVSSNGCADSMRQPNSISRRPGKASYKAQPEVSCTGMPVDFISTSVSFSSGEPNIHEWTIYDKDGVTVLKFQNTGALPRISYTFGDTGEYTVRLRVYNSKCSDTFSSANSVRIINPTSAVFVSNPQPCVKETINISATTTPSIAPATYNHNWLLQNTADTSVKYTATGSNVNIRPLKPGTYTLRLTTTWSGCTDVINAGFIEVSGPVLSVAYSNPDGCLPLVGNATSSLINNFNYKNPANTAITYSWTSVPATGVVIAAPAAANTQVTYTQRGQYTLRLIATNGSNCRDTFDYANPVYAGVRANFSVNKPAVCYGDTIAVTNLATLAPQAYQWLASPAGPVFFPSANAPAPQIYFPDSGTYIISQVVSKNNSCFDTFSVSVRSVQVIAGFSTLDTNKYCAPIGVTFINHSVNADSLFWKPGDGKTVRTVAASSFPYVYFTNSGPTGFDVKLIAKNNLGCIDSLTRPAYVTILGPVASFSVNTDVGCNPLEVAFTDNSHHYTEYYFDYGDGSVFDSTGNPGTHLYVNADSASEAKQYKPKLFLLDPQGCLAEFQYPGVIRVNNRPIVRFSGAPTSGCLPLTVQFKDSSQYASTFSWNFDNDGVEDATGANPKYTYTQNGIYTVRLRVTSQYGCVRQDTLPNYIAANGSPIAAFNLTRADNDTVNIYYDFINQSVNYSTLQWFHNNVLIGTAPLFKYAFNDTGYQTVKLVATNANNCTDTTDTTVYVVPDYFFHIPNAFTPNNKGGNETFGLYGPLWARKFIMRIYNRYGELIFETRDVGTHWDGTYNGEPCQQDMYLYSIEYLDIYSKWHVFHGTVLLLR